MRNLTDPGIEPASPTLVGWWSGTLATTPNKVVSSELLLLFQNPSKEVQNLANFLGIPLSEEKLKEIVDKTAFKKMKISNQKLETEAMKWFRDKNLRKGKYYCIHFLKL